jgi:hypothetical protein
MSLRDEIVRVAREQIGKPYDTRDSYPWEGPASDYDSFNCSGLTRAVFDECGVTIPGFQRASIGDSQSQWVMDAGNWHWTPADGLQPGDLVFWQDGETWEDTYHVGIYTGDEMCVSANGPRMGVAEHNVYIDQGFIGGGWPLSDRDGWEEPNTDIKEIDMTDWAIVAFDGAGYLYAGGKLHMLADPDEQKFVEYLYGEAKRQRDEGDMPHIVLGDGQDVIYGIGPWGKKLAEILAR